MALLRTNNCYFVGTLVEVKDHKELTYGPENKEAVAATIVLKCVLGEGDNAKNENNFIYEHAQFMRQWFFIYQNAFDAIKRARKDEIDGKPIYRNIDSIIEQAESEYAESQKKWEQVSKKWEGEK